jgi:hypothetical protein
MSAALSVTIPNPSRAERRAALVTQIALEREAIAGAWHQVGQRFVMAQNAWQLAGSFVRRPALILVVAVAVWVIGLKHGFSLLKGITRVRWPKGFRC